MLYTIFQQRLNQALSLVRIVVEHHKVTDREQPVKVPHPALWDCGVMIVYEREQSCLGYGLGYTRNNHVIVPEIELVILTAQVRGKPVKPLRIILD